MKVVKIIGVILLGLVGLAVLLYVIGIAVNWRDQPPSAAALEMKTILTDHPSVADEKNGFVYVMGFSVPASEDPQAAGVARMAWLAAVNRDPGLIDADPVKKDVDFEASKSRSMDRMRIACADSQASECRDAFLAAASQPRLLLQDLQLARYRELLLRPAWREVVPLDIRVPMARYGDIIEGQRLFLVDLAARAKSSAPEELAEALRDDLAFWREAQKSADFLITKMIAVAAIRQHFYFGNLVLREMPAGQAPVLESWGVPFTAEELSMRRSMAGELWFAEGTIRQWLDNAEGNLLGADAEALSLGGRIASLLALPYYQHQDQANYMAATYLDFARRFEVPLDRYAEVAEAVKNAAPEEFSCHVYNAVGHIFRGLAGTWNYTSYPIRVASIEGQRRAALLAAQSRARGVPPDAMAAEVGGAELRNPFDGKAFEWDADARAVIYTGPDAENSRKLHPYFH
jgi:hypothetical protein